MVNVFGGMNGGEINLAGEERGARVLSGYPCVCLSVLFCVSVNGVA